MSAFPLDESSLHSEMQLLVRGRILFTFNLEIILYQTVHRLIGLKSSSLEAQSRFGSRMMLVSLAAGSRHPRRKNSWVIFIISGRSKCQYA